MVKYWDRLKPEMDRRGMDVAATARALGVTFQAVAKVKDGGAFGSTNNLKAAAFFGVDPTYLANGRGVRQVSNISAGPTPRDVVPLISWVQAGAWCSAINGFEIGDAERLLPCPAAHGAQTYALRVRGDSMTAPSGNGRSYPEGCVIYVDPDKGSPINGERIIAKLTGSDDVTFKIYKEEDGRRWLMPLNPAHLPIRDEFSVCGTIIGKWEDG